MLKRDWKFHTDHSLGYHINDLYYMNNGTNGYPLMIPGTFSSKKGPRYIHISSLICWKQKEKGIQNI